MATLVQVTKRLHIPALIEITDPIFEHYYAHGLYWNLYESEIPGPLDDTYLPNMLFSYMQCTSADDPHEQSIVWHAAFALGMIHGGVLRRRDGALRLDVTTLVTLTDPECTRGYQAAREFYFIEAQSDRERRLTSTQVIEHLCELVEEYTDSRLHDPDEVVRYALGGIAGHLSGQLFPWTQAEHEAWEQDSIKWVGYVPQLSETCIAARLFVPVMTN